jgi:BirA family biotin operon repressor/biotin-[acetyl-CoA-carboxylase] ligase
MSEPELRWNADALRQQLAAHWPGLALEIVALTGSTSTDLLDRLRRSMPGATPSGDVQVRRSVESSAYARFTPCLRVAERQTDGRGRMGRRWHAERGASLTCSLGLPLARADWSGLSLAVGVAIAEALDGAGSRIALKWPNDLWLVDAPGRGRKLGGILIETMTTGPERVAVIGIGLNIGSLASAASLSSGFASLRELLPGSDAPDVLDRVAVPLVDAIRRFETDGFGAFHGGYARRDLLAGRPVRTTQPGLPEGIASGVTPRGELIVRAPDGRLHDVASGEVSVRVYAVAAGAARC